LVARIKEEVGMGAAGTPAEAEAAAEAALAAAAAAEVGPRLVGTSPTMECVETIKPALLVPNVL